MIVILSTNNRDEGQEDQSLIKVFYKWWGKCSQGRKESNMTMIIRIGHTEKEQKRYYKLDIILTVVTE